MTVGDIAPRPLSDEDMARLREAVRLGHDLGKERRLLAALDARDSAIWAKQREVDRLRVLLSEAAGVMDDEFVHRRGYGKWSELRRKIAEELAR
jgi:hypothetical protein